MATYFIDYAGGNDANSGLTFALRKKTMAGVTPAAGDEVRFAKSPTPTSIGNATWTSGFRQSGTFNSVLSSTNATPIVITTTIDHGLVAGDYVVIGSHTTNTNANGFWKVGTVPSSTSFQILQLNGANTTGNGVGGNAGFFAKATMNVIKLPTPLTQNIALCGGLGQKPAWTASASVTATQETSQYKEGYSCANININSAFTTGKAAYYTLPATLNLSGYQQVSFWIRQTTGTSAVVGDITLSLCSDSLGATAVNQVAIPAIPTNGVWQQVVVDLGTNLGTSINSVALYVNVDRGAQTFLLDNIIACKASSAADSITHASLLSKSDGSTLDHGWYGIAFINYDAICIGNAVSNNAISAFHKGYSYGTTETVTTYKREGFRLINANPIGASLSSVASGSSSTARVTYKGGWDTSTSMTTQTGRTWYDGVNGNSSLVSGSTGPSYVYIDKLDFCRYSSLFSTPTATAVDFNIDTMCATGNSLVTGNVNISGATWGTLLLTCNDTHLSIRGNGGSITKVFATGGSSGASLQNIYLTNIGELTTESVALGGNAFLVIESLTTGAVPLGTPVSDTYILGGTIGYIDTTSVSTCDLYLDNVTLTAATEIILPRTADAANGRSVYATRLDGAAGNNWIFKGMGTVNQQSTVTDSPATTSWKLSPFNGSLVNTTTAQQARSPVALKLATIVCAANALVTITARMRRDNTGLSMRLVCPGKQIAGVSSDAYSDMTAAADTWETVTITFTPTSAGAVDIYAYAFGGTTYNGYVCNITATQA